MRTFLALCLFLSIYSAYAYFNDLSYSWKWKCKPQYEWSCRDYKGKLDHLRKKYHYEMGLRYELSEYDTSEYDISEWFGYNFTRYFHPDPYIIKFEWAKYWKDAVIYGNCHFEDLPDIQLDILS